MYGSTLSCLGFACLAVLLAYILDVMLFCRVTVCPSIHWALSWWIETATVSTFSYVLFQGLFTVIANIFLLVKPLLCFLIASKTFVSFKVSSVAFYYQYASVLLVQSRTCSLATSLMCFITVNTFSYYATTVWSIMPP